MKRIIKTIACISLAIMITSCNDEPVEEPVDTRRYVPNFYRKPNTGRPFYANEYKQRNEIIDMLIQTHHDQYNQNEEIIRLLKSIDARYERLEQKIEIINVYKDQKDKQE